MNSNAQLPIRQDDTLYAKDRMLLAWRSHAWATRRIEGCSKSIFRTMFERLEGAVGAYCTGLAGQPHHLHRYGGAEDGAPPS